MKSDFLEHDGDKDDFTVDAPTALKKKIKSEMHGKVVVATHITGRTYQRGMKSDFHEHGGHADDLRDDDHACLACFHRMLELRFHFSIVSIVVWSPNPLCQT